MWASMLYTLDLEDPCPGYDTYCTPYRGQSKLHNNSTTNLQNSPARDQGTQRLLSWKWKPSMTAFSVIPTLQTRKEAITPSPKRPSPDTTVQVNPT